MGEQTAAHPTWRHKEGDRWGAEGKNPLVIFGDVIFGEVWDLRVSQKRGGGGGKKK